MARKARELRESLDPKKERSVSDLARLISTGNSPTGNFSLFLGAGASVSSGIRQASQLIKEWRDAVFSDLSADENASDEEKRAWLSQNQKSWYEEQREYSSLIEKVYPLPRSRRQMIEGEVSDKLPSIGYAYIVRLTEAKLFTNIFTTNFDDLLNESYYQFSNERPLVCAHDSSIDSLTLASDRTKIVKLHGDYLFDSLKNTSDETSGLEKNMSQKFREFLKVYGLIVSGYSGNDKSITRELADLLRDSTYLQNGLYWTFRENDHVNDEVFDLLKCENAFYVLVEGFDELFAELHSKLVSSSAPFTSRLAVSRADKLLRHYIENPKFADSGSTIIRDHINEIVSERESSLVSEALKEINNEQDGDDHLNDSDVLIFLEVEKLIRARKPDEAFSLIEQNLNDCEAKTLKRILLRRAFLCAKRLDRRREAIALADRSKKLDPDNYYIDLNKSEVLDKRSDRLSLLEEVCERAPFDESVFGLIAIEKWGFLNSEEADGSVTVDEVLEEFSKSLELDPSINNSSWHSLFSFIAENENSIKDSETRLLEVVETHLKQDAYDARSIDLLRRYCERLEIKEFNGKSLIDYALEAFRGHFPRDRAAHLRILRKIWPIAGNANLLRDAYFTSKKEQEESFDEDFTLVEMEIYYGFCRDLNGAIECGENAIQRRRSLLIEKRLVRLYSIAGNVKMAREILGGLKGALTPREYFRLKAEILEAEENYQDAVDAIYSIPDRVNFMDDYANHITFLYLRSGLFEKAHDIAYTFLKERNFAPHLRAVTLNYEFSKTKIGKSVKKGRLTSILDSKCDSECKAAAHMLLEEDNVSYELLRSEVEKDFSNVDEYLKWPILEGIHGRLGELRNSLLSSKRTLETEK